MTLSPLLSASPAIQIHVVAALLSIALLPVTLLRKRRDRLHKQAGYVWVSAMLITALSSFWINGIRLVGPFSPIHLLSVMTLFNVVWAVVEVRRGRVQAHERILKGTALWGLGVAGVFTLLPGRMMNEALFAQAPVAGFVAVFTGLVVALAWSRLPRGLFTRAAS